MTTPKDIKVTHEVRVIPTSDPTHDRRAREQLRALGNLLGCKHCGGTRWVRAISGSGDVPCPVCNATEGPA
jgi:hypothetical protein